MTATATNTATEKRYVAYYRVSTQKQGKDGLGIGAQQTTVRDWLKAHSGVLVGEFTEVESGRKVNRVELRKAIDECQLKKATLIIAKIDRLSRNATFMFQLQDSALDIVACDCPEMDKFSVRMLAVFAEREADLISQRTKAALAEAKVRGRKLGGWRGHDVCAQATQLATQSRVAKADDYAEKIAGKLHRAQRENLSLNAIARKMIAEGVRTPRGGINWTARTVKNLLDRIERIGA